MREDGEPTRRRAFRAEFSDEEWRLVSELAGYPNRLLVTATTAAGETYAEVAHEAIFKRWDKLKEWIAAEREFLSWRSGLEAARRAWEKTPDEDKNDALLMGFALTQAQSWLAQRPGDIPEADRTFIVESRKAARRRSLRVAGARRRPGRGDGRGRGGLVEAGLAEGREFTRSRTRPRSRRRRSAPSSRATAFKECRDCPEMIVVPAGRFMMGSPEGEGVTASAHSTR